MTSQLHSTGWKLYLHACLCTLHQSASTGNHTQVLGHPLLCQWTQGCPESPETHWHPRSSLLFLTAPWNLLIPVTDCKNIRSNLYTGKIFIDLCFFCFPARLTLMNHSSSSRIPLQNTLFVVNRGNWSVKDCAKKKNKTKNVTWCCWGSRKQLSFADGYLCNDYLYFIF